MNLRSFLYQLARLLGDMKAIKDGNIAGRIARRQAGKASGKWINGMFRSPSRRR